jgi:hypothetical protein
VRVTDEHLLVPSSLGVFTRASSTFEGEDTLYDWYSLDADPVLTLYTGDPSIASSLVPRLEAFLPARAAWERAATDAVVVQFSSETPSMEELDEAAADFALESVYAYPDGAIVVNLVDTCGQHFLEGYWLAVRFDRDDAVVEVTVEA